MDHNHFGGVKSSFIAIVLYMQHKQLKENLALCLSRRVRKSRGRPGIQTQDHSSHWANTPIKAASQSYLLR